MSTRSLPLALAGLLTLAPLSAQERGQAGEPWTVDDIIQQEGAGSWQLSRDGSMALWIRRRPDKEKDRGLGTLMLTDLSDGSSRELSVGQDGIGSPSFSPSGRYIAFTSGRDFPAGMKNLDKDQRGSQIWLLDLRGGMARPVSKIPFGVRGYQWHDDDTFFVVAREEWSREERKNKKRKDGSRVVEDQKLFDDGARRLFRYSWRQDKKLTRLTDNRDQIGNFSVSPDGRWALAMHAVSPSYTSEGLVPPRCWLHDLEAGTARELFADRKNKPQGFDWRHDSSRAFVRWPESTVDGENNATVSRLKELDPASGELRDVDLDWERGMSGSFVVTADGFLTGLADGVHTRFRRYVRAGDSYGAHDLRGTDIARTHQILKARDADRVLYIRGDASTPDSVCSATLDGVDLRDETEIHRPNEGFENKAIARTEILRWVGALDEEVEGILYYPHEYREGEKHPLVLITHGGPHGADKDRFGERWANSPNLYCQRGAFVLKTNYHGSSSYGLAWGESIKGRYYELEILDMFRGIETLEKRGLIDRERMGLVGWSNGAILSIAALTHARDYAPGFDYSFKACAPGAGDVNWTSDYGNCAFGGSFDDYYLGGAPWEMPDLYIQKSPLFRAAEVSTPTIIFFGTEDTSVPTEQGWQWYRALHKVGTPVRFVLFPGEPHGLGKLSHQRRKLEEELEWFDRWMFEVEDAQGVQPMEGSPLARAQQAAGPAQVDGVYGQLVGGSLLPELQPFADDVEVGRFEVTRAQWRAFRPDYPVPVGTENHPANEIDAADAQAYITWLNGRSAGGGAWRLLTAEESKGLAGASGPRENTLRWWAGFAPSPDEAPGLARQVEALGWQRALFAVGRGGEGHKKVAGTDRPFADGAGNVAEWVRDGDELVVRGLSAVSRKDDRGDEEPPPAAFVGLRVARDRSDQDR